MASASERASLSASIAPRSRRLAASNSKALANQMVQVSSEAKARPTITALTTMSAAMNMPHGDRSRGSVSAMAVGGAATAFGSATRRAIGPARLRPVPA